MASYDGSETLIYPPEILESILCQCEELKHLLNEKRDRDVANDVILLDMQAALANLKLHLNELTEEVLKVTDDSVADMKLQGTDLQPEEADEDSTVLQIASAGSPIGKTDKAETEVFEAGEVESVVDEVDSSQHVKMTRFLGGGLQIEQGPITASTPRGDSPPELKRSVPIGDYLRCYRGGRFTRPPAKPNPPRLVPPDEAEDADANVKCDFSDFALRVFEMIEVKPLILRLSVYKGGIARVKVDLNAMISVYAQWGRGLDGLRFFGRMMQTATATIIYVGVLVVSVSKELGITGSYHALRCLLRSGVTASYYLKLEWPNMSGNAMESSGKNDVNLEQSCCDISKELNSWVAVYFSADFSVFKELPYSIQGSNGLLYSFLNHQEWRAYIFGIIGYSECVDRIRMLGGNSNVVGSSYSSNKNIISYDEWARRVYLCSTYKHMDFGTVERGAGKILRNVLVINGLSSTPGVTINLVNSDRRILAAAMVVTCECDKGVLNLHFLFYSTLEYSAKILEFKLRFIKNGEDMPGVNPLDNGNRLPRIELTDVDGNRCIAHRLPTRKDKFEVHKFKYLLQPKVYVYASDHDWGTFLVQANRQGYIETVNRVQERGADFVMDSDTICIHLRYLFSTENAKVLRIFILTEIDLGGQTGLSIQFIWGAGHDQLVVVGIMLKGHGNPNTDGETKATLNYYVLLNSTSTMVSLSEANMMEFATKSVGSPKSIITYKVKEVASNQSTSFSSVSRVTSCWKKIIYIYRHAFWNQLLAPDTINPGLGMLALVFKAKNQSIAGTLKVYDLKEQDITLISMGKTSVKKCAELFQEIVDEVEFYNRFNTAISKYFTFDRNEKNCGAEMQISEDAYNDAYTYFVADILIRMDYLPEAVVQFILAHLSNVQDVASCVFQRSEMAICVTSAACIFQGIHLGDAYAIDLDEQTKLDDFRREVTETFDLDVSVFSIKYFIPGNIKTLITVSKDKDHSRMISFVSERWTVDVFVSVAEIPTQVISNMPAFSNDHNFLMRYINKFNPRPSEVDDLEDKVVLKGRVMLRSYYLAMIGFGLNGRKSPYDLFDKNFTV